MEFNGDIIIFDDHEQKAAGLAAWAPVEAGCEILEKIEDARDKASRTYQTISALDVHESTKDNAAKLAKTARRLQRLNILSVQVGAVAAPEIVNQSLISIPGITLDYLHEE